MDSYTSFAYVYDTFMDQEPYDEWADRVCAFLDRYGSAGADVTDSTDSTDPEQGWTKTHWRKREILLWIWDAAPAG